MPVGEYVNYKLVYVSARCVGIAHLKPVGYLVHALNIGNQHVSQLLKEKTADDASQREDTFMKVEGDPAMLVIARLSLAVDQRHPESNRGVAGTLHPP